MSRAQRVALTVALAVVLVVIGWSVVPFSAGAASCGSAVTAAFVDGPDVGRRYLSHDTPCPDAARERLVTGAIVVGLAGAFAAVSFRLLADADSPVRERDSV